MCFAQAAVCLAQAVGGSCKRRLLILWVMVSCFKYGCILRWRCFAQKEFLHGSCFRLSHWGLRSELRAMRAFVCVLSPRLRINAVLIQCVTETKEQTQCWIHSAVVRPFWIIVKRCFVVELEVLSSNVRRPSHRPMFVKTSYHAQLPLHALSAF